MKYADGFDAREKIERKLSLGSVKVTIEREDIKPAGLDVARFELRNDKEFCDADYITWSGGTVLRVAPGLNDAAVDAVVRAYREGREDGEYAGKTDLQRELRHLIGAASSD